MEKLYAKTHTRGRTIPVRISPDLLRRIDEKGRVRSEFIRAAMEYYLHHGAPAIDVGAPLHLVDASGEVVAEVVPVRRGE